MMNRGRQRSNYYLSRSFLAITNLRSSSRWGLTIRIEKARGDFLVTNHKSIINPQWLRYSSSEQNQKPTMRKVQQMNNHSPMERIMKAWADEAINCAKKSSVVEELKSISHNILAWTKAFEESSCYLSSPASKGLEITSNQEESTSATISKYIYTLKLHSGKFYVGKSSDPEKRYQMHLNGKGSAWTKKYKPIAMVDKILMTSAFDEDKYTKEYMIKHGRDNVRGATYVTEELDDVQKESLKREFWSASDKCTRCGRSGHFVSKCYANTDVEGNSL